ncbi:OmpH family outer membrane protein [Sphingomonas sp.]|uniref:OmpH family outer membrane protein n=1 Tax=Sphingomonas sp. TaxID=28214 RepID=UPI00286E7896|nr:OmpH family outer membrane protein [Sphingomonas sp.]
MALPSVASAQRAPAAVIVVVDTDRVYRECTACRTAQTSLQGQVTALQTRQQTLANGLRPEGTAIQNAITALAGKAPDAALRARVDAFQKRQETANQELGRAQQNLQSVQANVLRQINERLNPAINQVMTARGANLAVDTDATLARSQGLDVTADVLAALNRTLPSVSLTPLPQAQQQTTPGR